MRMYAYVCVYVCVVPNHDTHLHHVILHPRPGVSTPSASPAHASNASKHTQHCNRSSVARKRRRKEANQTHKTKSACLQFSIEPHTQAHEKHNRGRHAYKHTLDTHARAPHLKLSDTSRITFSLGQQICSSDQFYEDKLYTHTH